MGLSYTKMQEIVLMNTCLLFAKFVTSHTESGNSFISNMSILDYHRCTQILRICVDISLDQIVNIARNTLAQHFSNSDWEHTWRIIYSVVDYTINDSTRAKISGSRSPASFVEYWQFVRRDGQWVLNRVLQKNESGQIDFSE